MGGAAVRARAARGAGPAALAAVLAVVLVAAARGQPGALLLGRLEARPACARCALALLAALAALAALARLALVARRGGAGRPRPRDECARSEAARCEEGAAVSLRAQGKGAWCEEGAASLRAQGKGAVAQASPQEPEACELWYKTPAKDWLDALPVGCGRVGAMVWGRPDVERVQLNHENLWGGGPWCYDSPEGLAALPEIRRLVLAGDFAGAATLVDAKFLGRPARQMPFEPVGELALELQPAGSEFSEYRRSLDLDTATTSVRYKSQGVVFEREVLASFPAQVVAMRLGCDRAGALSFTARLSSPLQRSSSRAEDACTVALEGTSDPQGNVEGRVRFTVLVRVVAEGAAARVQVGQDGSLAVSVADGATLLVSVATSYRRFDDVSLDACAAARATLAPLRGVGYAALRAAHVADIQPLLRRVRLRLPGSREALPTDERVRAFAQAAGGSDEALVALHFQYGRYLLLASSRPGCAQPANLQGIWNPLTSPPWESKFTSNINVEMNYWLAGPANLLECYAPLLTMLSELAEAGQRTARTQYGARGWVLHHNTDGWRGTAPVDTVNAGMWPCGGAWLCKSVWDSYEFSGDTRLLRRHFADLRGACEFFLDTLQESQGFLVTCPSLSPEVSHPTHPGQGQQLICAGPTLDNLLLADLFDGCRRAAELLGRAEEGETAPFLARLAQARARLAPLKIGKAGQLQEWMEDWDVENEDQHNRHVSHLYALFPGAHISRRKTAALFAAAKKSLEMRGDAATGWSLAWKINLWARLEDGEHARKLIGDLLCPEHTAPNLFDLHPPFQIDGNFGAVSGVCEMLLQSHLGELHLLPALPLAWASGNVSGLRARTGLELDIQWDNSQVRTAALRSQRAGIVTLRATVRLHVAQGATKVDQRVEQQGSEFLVTFNAEADAAYDLHAH